MSELFKASLSTRGVRVGFAVMLLAAVILSFIPLFDVLGFERAFISGVLIAPLSALAALSVVRRARDLGGRDPSRVALTAWALSLLMLVPTAIAGGLVELITQPCDPGEGLVVLGLTAGISAAFGSALGTLAGVTTHRRLVPGSLVILVLLACLGTALWRLYSQPQIFIYSAPFGYWPGSLYDEEVTLGTSLVAHRAYSFVLAATMVAFARAVAEPDRLLISRDGVRMSALVVAAACAGVSWLIHSSGRELGFDVDRSSIESALSKQVVGDRIILYVDPSISKEDLAQLRREHLFRYQQLEAFFGTRPKRPIKSYVYRSVEQKKRLMGAGHTQIARPWAGEIHIHGFGVPHRVLKHELAHIFAAELASGPFKVPAAFGVFVNIGIVEGTAVAADWPANELTIHGWTRAMRALDLAPDPRRTLYPTGFWSISSARAYTVAGSFIRYLYDQYGIDKLAVLYRDNDFKKAYGRSLDALANEWESYIDGLEIPEDELVFAEHRFKRPGIFQKVCAHEVANLSEEGYRALSSGDLDLAAARLEKVFAYEPQSIGHLLALSRAFAKEGEMDRAQRYAKRAADTPNITQKAKAEAEELIADLDVDSGKIDEASKIYERLATLDISVANTRLLIAKQSALERDEPLRSLMHSYLRGDLEPAKALLFLDRAAREHPEDGLLRYLLARRLEMIRAYPEAVVEIEAAIADGLPGSAIQTEAQMTLGRLQMAVENYEGAAEVFEHVARSSDATGARLLAEDWAARARFAQSEPRE